MKRINYVFFLLILLVNSCEYQSTAIDSDKDANIDGIVNIILDMSHAPSHVAGLQGKLENDAYQTILFDFQIESDQARALVENIPVGLWKLSIEAFDANETTIYSGSTLVQVQAGIITPVSIHLDPATGSIDIKVTWGNDCVDIDGHMYKTVKIGEQVWMAENLKVTHYNNGEEIPNVKNNSDWITLSIGAYCVYDNKAEYKENYGFLYNWFAIVDPRGIAPQGWHVASDEEWKTLELYLGMDPRDADKSDVNVRGTDEGNKLKSERGWSNGGGGSNESGFSGLPGGFRNSHTGRYESIGTHGTWWTASGSGHYTAWERRLETGVSTIGRWFDDHKRHGFSVRCIKDQKDHNNFDDDEFEENDTQSTAKPLIEYTYYRDLTIKANDDDWYSLTISADSLSILCTFEHQQGDINMELVDKDGHIIASAKSRTNNEYIQFIVDCLDTYYIHIYLSSGQNNNYTFWWDDIQQGESRQNRSGG